LETANKLATADKLEESNKVIEEALRTVTTSTTADDEYVKGLMNDLTECKESLKDKASFKRGGEQKMNNMYMAHSKQRSAKPSPSISSNDSNASPAYQTNAKKKMISKVNGNY